MINMLRKGIKFSMQKVYFRKVIFNVDPIVNVLNALKKFKSLTFQLRAIWFHTFAIDMTVVLTFWISIYMHLSTKIHND